MHSSGKVVYSDYAIGYEEYRIARIGDMPVVYNNLNIGGVYYTAYIGQR